MSTFPCRSHRPEAGRNAEVEGRGCPRNETRPSGARSLGTRELLGVLTCSWNFMVQVHRADCTHTHTRTPSPVVQSVSNPASSPHPYSYCPVQLLSSPIGPGVGAGASSLPLLPSTSICPIAARGSLLKPKTCLVVNLRHASSVLSAQNPLVTPTSLRVKAKALKWPSMNCPHYHSPPSRLHCS